MVFYGVPMVFYGFSRIFPLVSPPQGRPNAFRREMPSAEAEAPEFGAALIAESADLRSEVSFPWIVSFKQLMFGLHMDKRVVSIWIIYG